MSQFSRFSQAIDYNSTIIGALELSEKSGSGGSTAAEAAFADLETIEQGAGSSRAAARKAAAMLLSAGQAIEAAPRTSLSPALEAAAREIEALSKELQAAANEPKGAVDEAASAVESDAPRRSAAP